MYESPDFLYVPSAVTNALLIVTTPFCLNSMFWLLNCSATSLSNESSKECISLSTRVPYACHLPSIPVESPDFVHDENRIIIIIEKIIEIGFFTTTLLIFHYTTSTHSKEGTYQKSPKKFFRRFGTALDSTIFIATCFVFPLEMPAPVLGCFTE